MGASPPTVSDRLGPITGANELDEKPRFSMLLVIPRRFIASLSQ